MFTLSRANVADLIPVMRLMAQKDVRRVGYRILQLPRSLRRRWANRCCVPPTRSSSSRKMQLSPPPSE